MADFVQHSGIQALAWALVHFLWQGAAIGLASFVAFRLTRSASLRYATGVGALVAMIAAPVTTVAVLGGAAAAQTAVSAATDIQITLGLTAPVETLADSSAPIAGSSLTIAPEVLAVAVLAWLGGVTFFGVRLIGGWVVARRLTRRAVQPASEHIQAVARQLADRLAINRAVTILQSSAVIVPVMVGWLKPAVILPMAALAGLSPSQLEALLAHELAHVRRQDYLVNLLQSVAEALLFYHPAVWWLSHRVRADRELCCDDLTVSVCDPLVYATALTDLAAMTSSGLALAATDGDLLGRVRRILGQSEVVPTMRAGAMPVLALVLVAGVAVPVALASTQAPVVVRPVEVAVELPVPAPLTIEARKVVLAEPGQSVVVEADRVTLQQTPAQEAERQRLLEEARRKLQEAQRERVLIESRRAEDLKQVIEQVQKNVAMQSNQVREIEARQSEAARVLEHAKMDLSKLKESGIKSNHPDYQRAEKTIQELTNALDKAALQTAVADAQVTSQRRQAELELARTRNLFEKGLASEQQLREVQAALARLEAAGNPEALQKLELQAALEKLAKSQKLVEKGLISQRDLAAVEEELRQLAMRLEQARARRLDIAPETAKSVSAKELYALLAQRQTTVSEQAAAKEQLSRAANEQLMREVQSRSERVREEAAGQPVAANEPVRVGDYLRVDVEGEDMRMNYRVGDEGTIKMPLIGPIKVVGLTAAQVRDAIGKQLVAHKLKTAEQVKVTVTRVR
jgi:beta-lactamase regulating signal transducer with metallopeptidase domain